MVDIKVEGDGVKVLGGGTQAYNKDNRDKRRPLVMTSPGQRQKILKRANDPEFKELDDTIETLKSDLKFASDTIEYNLDATQEMEEKYEATIKTLESEIASLKEELEAAAKPAPKTKAAPKSRKPAAKDSGD